MKNRLWVSLNAIRGSTLLMVLLLGLVAVPAFGAEITESVIGRYDDFDIDNAPTVGMGLFPTVVLEPKDIPSPKRTPLPFSATASGDLWITISPFSGTLNGYETFLIAGYLSGTRSGVTLTVRKKSSADSDYVPVETLKPDENGLFVWAVPADMKNNLFSVTASTSSGSSVSNGIRFVAEEESNPVIKPVTSPASSSSITSSVSSTTPSLATPAPTAESVSGKSSVPGITKLSISTKTTTPSVGDDVVISGRLTDANGKGIRGATINLDETGYPGAQQAEPFSTTSTDSEGRFEFTIQVSFANIVGLYAYYDGDDTYMSSDSNTLTFSTI